MASFVPWALLIFLLVVATIEVSSGHLDISQTSYDLDLKSGKSSDQFTFDLISHRRLKRDTEEDVSKYKKVSTKKPTQPIKPKPTSAVPYKAPSSIQASSSSDESHTVPSVSQSEVNSHPSAMLAPTETPFTNPEDATPPPASNTTEDTHIYYNSTIISDKSEVSKLWIEQDDELSLHDMLSNSHRRAATIQLKFPFPFYGHQLKNITIATGGFLYLGETVHSWLAATQYIAPLMANFDTSTSNFSDVKYLSNDTHFIVQWKDVELNESNPPGNFSFQVTLKNNGDIIFVYKEIPFAISKIPDSKHPVKVGISDAYVIDRTVFFIRRKTIYEYHRAELNKDSISNNTAIYFTALPTCVSMNTCEACLTTKIPFECRWCSAVNRCSDGFDRHRQEWLTNKCETESHNKDNPDRCKAPPVTQPSSPSFVPTSSSIPSAKSKTDTGDLSGSSFDYKHASEHRVNVDGGSGEGHSAGVMFFMVLFGLIAGSGLWVFYAYKNPQTSSGQFLIRYRPAEWRWNSNGDTRYTAASIHM